MLRSPSPRSRLAHCGLKLLPLAQSCQTASWLPRLQAVEEARDEPFVAHGSHVADVLVLALHRGVHCGHIPLPLFVLEHVGEDVHHDLHREHLRIEIL